MVSVKRIASARMKLGQLCFCSGCGGNLPSLAPSAEQMTVQMLQQDQVLWRRLAVPTARCTLTLQ